LDNEESYINHVKPNARIFIKINGFMILKPDWYDSKRVPGNGLFKLVNTNNSVVKFMETILARRIIPSDYNIIGSEHCNQTSPVNVYRLEPITIEEGYINQFGKTLFNMFFKRYTEKLWGTSCKNISADWLGQRSRGLNISTVIKYVGFTPVVPKPPDARVLPVSNGLSEA
jgi:hypothetical protein